MDAQSARIEATGGAAGWPVMTIAEATAALTAPGALFEMEEVEIGGRTLRTWKNQPRTLAALARRARDMFGTREFIIYEDDRVTYDGWFRAVCALALALRGAGVGKGDRVAIAMRNLPEWPVAFFAATAIGAIAVPLNAWWTGGELAYGLADSGAKLLICDYRRSCDIAPFRGQLSALRQVWVARAQGRALTDGATPLESRIGPASGYGDLPERDLPDENADPDDGATIFYTSGTTGKPKGALGTHRNILTCTLTGAFASQRSALRRGEVPAEKPARTGLLVIPLFHVTACNSSLMGTLMAGNRLVMMRKWDAGKALALIEREKVNTTGGVPAIAWQLIEHPDRDRYDLSSLEFISYGGAPSAPELVRRIGGDLKSLPGNGYGMTETSATVTFHGAEDYVNRPESCGPPMPVTDLKVMDADTATPLEAGAVGELWVRGPQVVKGYWNRPEDTAQTFVDGWVRTGDIARLDEEGFLTIVDRAKDIVIRGGENIYSSEVENVLYEHPAVTDAALVGIPDKVLGEEPAAVVHCAPGRTASEAELQQWVRERLAGFKVPVRVLFRSEPLPRNANGKILKAELKRLFA
ncbi:class I adenylate-forming enzyme family protein [Croceicoccus hydrothermalis]|uniref:class I adenylate-forming enzyme family protein n=1 Tax=Croceicoccus hydrothermalis TaxID=2867964 RepID=UPI001EFB004F|nr:AMP-binding protein [Croceicoccus hydrothermalis]